MRVVLLLLLVPAALAALPDALAALQGGYARSHVLFASPTREFLFFWQVSRPAPALPC